MDLGFNKVDFCKYNKLENLTTNPKRYIKVLLKVKRVYVLCNTLWNINLGKTFV